MKMIEAVIHKLKLQEVRSALDDIGVEDFMESSVICHGQKGRTMIFRGAKFEAYVAEKVKLEIIAADDCVGKVIEVIGNIARTQRMEDCRIYILPSLETGFCAVPC